MDEQHLDALHARIRALSISEQLRLAAELVEEKKTELAQAVVAVAWSRLHTDTANR